MSIYAFRLSPQQDLKEALETAVKTNNMTAGVILSSVGSLSHIHLRLAGGKNYLTLTQDFEILSLNGTLSIYGSHLHLAVGDSHGKTYGGHLMAGCIIRTTAEIVIQRIDSVDFKRELDDKTGYKELAVKLKQHPVLSSMDDTL